MSNHSDDSALQNAVSANARETQDYFLKRPSLYGDSHKSVDWGTADGQIRRFQALADAVTLKNRSILDVGSGMGHLVAWLEKNNHQIGSYEGIDITPTMVESARKLHPSHLFSVCNLAERDQPLLTSYDIVFAGGIFYLSTHMPYEYIDLMLRRMISLASYAVVFNLLVGRPPEKASSEEFVAEMSKLVDVIERHSYLYRIDHSYSKTDATVTLFVSR